ncbi:MarR family winged helix-turn-helix transcriptional regulator [Stappia sp.]|jgi:DNA-binding MarR family transcriptional regulator|uniref:MarR family winged helix-turn-helix transcriptional regulator n=1 Tax=Stappia sp. TaxID=1870903 RepID=UPI003A9A48C9
MKADVESLYALLQQVRPLHRRVARSVAAHLEGTGLGTGARAVLSVLSCEGAMSVPQIGRTLFLPRQNVQKWVDELLARGLVERHANPAHRRSWLIALTVQGKELFAAIREREDGFAAALAGRLDAADVDTARRVLSACLDHFTAFEDDPDRPRPLA